MADIPVPRSRSQIVGEMVDAVLARLGLPSLKVGSPTLSIIEASAQSDLRSSQDIFNLLNSLSLDRASGQALDRLGADEQVPRIGETPSSGRLSIGDSSFAKLATRIYQGGASPIVGTTALPVEDAAAFPATGSVYIGRGTTNLEGPLAYTAKTNLGSFWTLTLSSGTTKFHNLGESVVLAQGGNREVPAGTLVRTPQGNAGAAVQFATTFAATVPDGEIQIDDVPGVARAPGVIGNVIAGSIREFVSSPFPGATVNNPGPFSNGLNTESDQEYRERIRDARQSRTKGTALAVQSGVIGLTSLAENSRVLSASVVSREDEPVSLYIDDGTGYEEKTAGVAYEVVAESSAGGEQYFQLAQGRPVTKAFLKSSLTAPFALVADCALAVEVGGVETVHVFPATDFRAVGTASAFEVVASINSDPTLFWNARLAEGGSAVSLFAKTDTNEDIQISAVDDDTVDANDFLGFPVAESRSLWLYRDDRLLNKDGKPAVLVTNPQATWGAITSGATFFIEVDGIPVTWFGRNTIIDLDFVNAGTQFVTVNANNSLASWATVLNYLLPGITAVPSGGGLQLTSNAGRTSRAHLKVTGGTLLTAMFGNDLEDAGSDLDYTMDRNLGQIKLVEPLLAGQRLSAGSLATRSFLETPSFTTITVGAEATSVAAESGAELWVVVDGAADLISTSVGAGTVLDVTNPASPAWGKRVRYISTTAAALFTNVRAGDWVIVTDTNLLQPNRGAFRVVVVDGGFTWVEVEQVTTWASPQTSISLAIGGLKVVRTTAVPQRLYVPAGSNYTALSLTNALNAVGIFNPPLRGAEAVVYRTTRVRVRTNSFTGGDIAAVAGNAGGLALGFPLADALPSGVSHLANLIAGGREDGTPSFRSYSVSTVTSSTVINYGSGTVPSSGDLVGGLKTLPDGGGQRWGNESHVSSLDNRAGTILTLRTPVVKHWLPEQRFYFASPFALTARDQLGVTVDGDDVQKRYVINTYRRIKPTTGTYGITNTFKDVDNGNASLAQAFGVGFIWRDFAIHMKARQKANGIMWRYYRHGPEGNRARVAYGYPTAPGAVVGISTTSRNTIYTDITVTLASGAARTIANLRNTSYLGVAVLSGPSVDSLFQYLYVMQLPVASGSREIRLNYSAGSAGTGTVTGGTSGASATVLSSTGTYLVITAVAGTFINGEALTFTAGGPATCSGSQYGHTTLTLTLPATTPAVTDHGLQINDPVWLQSTDVNFSTGAKVVVARTTTTISYTDVATTTGAIAGTLTISRDTAGEVSLSGASAIATDIWSIGTGTGLHPAFVQTLKTLTLSNDRVTANSPVDPSTFAPPASVGTVLNWYPLNASAALQVYPLDAGSNATAAIISTVGAAANTPITGFEYLAGTISFATYEAPPNGLGANNSGLGPYYYLVDGINWVRSHNTPVLPTDDFTFTFKDAVDAGLAASSDWVNEDVRAVPITAANVVGFLDTAAVGGLFGVSEIISADRAGRPQVTTITAGSSGSVQSTGGTANAVSGTVVGNAISAAGTLTVAAVTSSVTGLGGQTWVALNNAITAPKTIITASTALTTFSALGEVLLSGTKAWKYSGNVVDALTVGGSWQVERQGDFTAFVKNGGGAPDGFASVQEGDWVAVDPRSVDTTYATTGTLSTLNRGLFRVVRTDTTSNTFWIENSRSVEEIGTVDVAFFAFNSVMPGDSLIVNTVLWGPDNLGTWSVTRIDITNQFRFYLDVSTRVPVTTGPVAALGINSNLVQIYEAVPSRLIKRLIGIAPNGSLTDLKFETEPGFESVNSAYGTVVQSLDKLDLGLTASGSAAALVPGIDGYVRNTGLIEEANRTVYGDESQSSSYPGIAAAGANININGPLARRIQVSLALRVTTGISILDIQNKVRSAVAAVINETGVGAPVAISELISAAQSVNGVVAVTVLSPVYGTGNDVVSVQPFEKPLVIDLEQDIQVSFIGD